MLAISGTTNPTDGTIGCLNEVFTSVSEFNDRTPDIIIDQDKLSTIDRVNVLWIFEADRWEKELFVLQCVMDEIGGTVPVRLRMEYVPNARMDRSGSSPRRAFTLRTFAKLINNMGFEEVVVMDPHSDVVPALIERCTVEMPNLELLVKESEPVWVFPDAGAMHRYSKLLPKGSEVTFGEKTRDWETNHITGYKLYGAEAIRDRDVVIVDDIIAHGYTLKFLLAVVEKYGPASITIYATHIEESFMEGPLYKMLKRRKDIEIYTTQSILKPWARYGPTPVDNFLYRIVRLKI